MLCYMTYLSWLKDFESLWYMILYALPSHNVMYQCVSWSLAASRQIHVTLTYISCFINLGSFLRQSLVFRYDVTYHHATRCVSMRLWESDSISPKLCHFGLHFMLYWPRFTFASDLSSQLRCVLLSYIFSVCRRLSDYYFCNVKTFVHS